MKKFLKVMFVFFMVTWTTLFLLLVANTIKFHVETYGMGSGELENYYEKKEIIVWPTDPDRKPVSPNSQINNIFRVGIYSTITLAGVTFLLQEIYCKVKNK